MIYSKGDYCKYLYSLRSFVIHLKWSYPTTRPDSMGQRTPDPIS